MSSVNINCMLFHKGLCSHASARTIFGGCKHCILMPYADPRIGACRVQVPFPRPKEPPPGPFIEGVGPAPEKPKS